MSEAALYPRYAAPRLRDALADSPVVLIHGPRQCGKTTLARQVSGEAGYTYLTFDDAATLSAATRDPAGFVADLPDRVILDEVQHALPLFPAIKAAVDRRRTPGRFLLTGSANILLLPALSESLAGRIEILRLHPLAQAELARVEGGFIEALFDGTFKITTTERLGRELATRIAAGGYPPALARRTAQRRAVWYRSYIDTIVQRDIRELTRISALDALPRLLQMAASQSAQLLNVSGFAAPLELSRPTVRDYVTLLEHVFLLDILPPWHNKRLKRLIKTPKVHVGDTGLALALLGADADTLATDRELLGHVLETFVFQELRREASWRDDVIAFYHFRDRDGAEVDIVLEWGSREVAGVEVKAGGTVTASDFAGLRKLRDAAGRRFAAGVVLYDGEVSVPFGDSLFAVPIRRLWETARA